MTTDDAVELLRTIIGDLGLEVSAPLTLDADLRRDLGVDSVDFLDILFEVNERCGLALTLEELLEHPDTTKVATVVGCITARVPVRASRAEEVE